MMLSSKEKAEKLVNKYFKDSDLLYHDLSWIQAKECALIAVDEMISEAGRMKSSYMGRKRYEYLLEVKQEIEKL
jgi:hypothetical protein